ncbi:hypothetical protein MPTK1_2g26430 [Marchantia polymorpha subsp. ruderalis]|uniref:Uncharacterized protein n=1 Tax=Marchantia polymorpha TaxID=3197 RepID=A0A2R6XB58_MARPO|nr:hypothetical protein MARPO_0025s0041 [Marchantia polymorpha]BBN03789.1 hypothetical protein Mp_2g26430 [Marchantia polymorpha subsp. ruderalis]|eukprot:PTQ43346.1 hypothetical protein MARPO_0025s0041 [Marchantia polymorpha]
MPAPHQARSMLSQFRTEADQTVTSSWSPSISVPRRTKQRVRYGYHQVTCRSDDDRDDHSRRGYKRKQTEIEYSISSLLSYHGVRSCHSLACSAHTRRQYAIRRDGNSQELLPSLHSRLFPSEPPMEWRRGLRRTKRVTSSGKKGARAKIWETRPKTGRQRRDPDLCQ